MIKAAASRQLVMSRLLILLLVLLCSGCGGMARKSYPPPIEKAIRANERGVHGEELKNFARADAQFMEAYRLYSSVENYEGMLITLINRIRIHRQLGQLSQADSLMKRADEIVAEVPELYVEICFEKAKIALLRNSFDEAIAWCDKGISSARSQDQGRMLNLSAEIWFRKGDLVRANGLAQEGLAKSRTTNQLNEVTNALRLLGEISLRDNQPAKAREQFLQALAIDKERGIPSRIATDLRGVSRSLEMAGDLVAAAAWQRRAANVSVASSDTGQATADLETLELLLKKEGKASEAQEIRLVREKLQSAEKAGVRP